MVDLENTTPQKTVLLKRIVDDVNANVPAKPAKIPSMFPHDLQTTQRRNRTTAITGNTISRTRKR